MQINSDNDILASSKTFILYILHKIKKAIDTNSLFNIITSIEDMNYFYFKQFLLNLVETKNIICYEKDHITLYEITSIGEKTLDLAIDLIPGIIKFNIDSKIKSTLETINTNNSIVAEYTPDNENSFLVTCKIIENNNVVFQIQINAGSQEQAKTIINTWETNAYTLYPNIIKLLTN